MWKLKIAEGGNDPYIFSTNNFVGRQIWEFDPEAGSPEERAEVEEARQNFYKNRYQIKPSGDLLWRMQVVSVPGFYKSRQSASSQPVPQSTVDLKEQEKSCSTSPVQARSSTDGAEWTDSMSPERVTETVQNIKQQSVTNHSLQFASCTSPSVTRSLKEEVNESDKDFNANNYQQSPSLAGNVPQPLNSNSSLLSTFIPAKTINTIPAHSNQNGNLKSHSTSDSMPLFTPIIDSHDTRAHHSSNLNQNGNCSKPSLNPFNETQQIRTPHSHDLNQNGNTPNPSNPDLNRNLTPSHDSFTPCAKPENSCASSQPPKPKWTRLVRQNHQTPANPTHTSQTLGKRTPMQDDSSSALPNKR
nr:germanicol synthase [Quercus suber]